MFLWRTDPSFMFHSVSYITCVHASYFISHSVSPSKLLSLLKFSKTNFDLNIRALKNILVNLTLICSSYLSIYNDIWAIRILVNVCSLYYLLILSNERVSYIVWIDLHKVRTRQYCL